MFSCQINIGASGKESACQGDIRGMGSILGSGESPWYRKWQDAPVFLTGKIPWIEESGGLQSMGPQRVGHDFVTEQQQM